jgi:hypothetical protein
MHVPISEADNHLYDSRETLTTSPDGYRQVIDHIDLRGHMMVPA